MKILNRYNKEIIFEDKSSTIKETVENAVKQNVSLKSAILNNIDLSNINLSYADLRDALLYKSNLNNTDLTTTDLSYAYLYEASLTNTNLEGVDLTSQWLYGTNLRDAKLREIDIEKLYFGYNKYRNKFNYVKEEVLNHPNCSEKLKLKIKMYNLLS